jgi:hypothetical protein
MKAMNKFKALRKAINVFKENMESNKAKGFLWVQCFMELRGC